MKIRISFVEDLTKTLEGSTGYALKLNNDNCDIFIDSRLSNRERRLVAVHEVLDVHLQGKTKHSNIDKIAIDIIEALRQIGELE